MNIIQVIANELAVKAPQVESVIKLLDEGATVPFIARYRKEATGGLDDTQLRNLEERLVYLRELLERRDSIIASIKEQNKLTPELEQELIAADTKARLEDLYLPFKPKRRTKAQIARESGLEELAYALLNTPDLKPEAEAAKYIDADKNVADVAAALEGAKYILMEDFAENADLVNLLRKYLWQNSIVTSVVVKEQEEAGIKFKDYYAFQEELHKIPSHRALALFRGQKEGFLRLAISFPDAVGDKYCQEQITKKFAVKDSGHAASFWLQQVVDWTWKIKLKIKLDVDCFMRLRETAEEQAIDVFKENLYNLLMASPAGKKVTLGLDPGYRTGVKTVVVSDTGKLLDYTVIFPHHNSAGWNQSLAVLASMCQKHKVNLISIGNGTASRETEKLAKELIKLHPDLHMTSIVVSEAGASVYSASALAAEEFPDLDVSYRGAVSIARRLQDPLAELVKIDPKAIGVGQYQHDVNQCKLIRGLETILEDCVNAVGADVNTASVPLLKSIAGLNETAAKNIVAFREVNGRFATREELKKVPRFGDKTYEQAIGFLRIIGGAQPLDASAVHPEAYQIVDAILAFTKIDIAALMGDEKTLNSLNASDFVTDQFGLVTVRDIISELKKPGRDPRPEFINVNFKEGIEEIADLKIGMKLDGVVTNVTNFGAFVDIGVHQDGLVHVSQLSNQFVKDPAMIVKVGQIVAVTVLEVDVKRKRIQLTMKSDGATTAATTKDTGKPVTPQKTKAKKVQPEPMSGFADALKKALK